MAILDKLLVFSEDQAVTATAASTNAIDLGQGGDAVGQEPTIRALVTVPFATLTSLTVKLQTSSDNSNWDDVLLTPAIAAASLVKGKEIFCVRVPHGLKRYVRLNYVVAGSNATAGKVYAYMSKEL